MQESLENKRILYLEGRPSAHPVHKKLALSLNADVEHIDSVMRWQDKGRSLLYNAIAWIVNGIALLSKKRYDIILVDNLHFAPIIFKYLKFGRKKPRIVVHLGSHTLYFMYSNRFSKLNTSLHKFFLSKYDALLCEGEMAAELAHKMLGKETPPCHVTFLGPLKERGIKLSKCEPDLNSKNLLIIAAGPGEFRKFYKGIDLMIASFALVLKKHPGLTLTILGQWDQPIIEECLNHLSEGVRKQIQFKGSISNIEDYLAVSSLCLHCTRGDAFPTSTIEAMSAGVPVLVSEWTGTKQITKEISGQLIVPLDKEIIADRINWYLDLPKSEKLRLSELSRKHAGNYTEESAIAHYREVFKAL